MAFKFPAGKADKLEDNERYERLRPVERLRNAGVQEGDAVLDIGAGTGFYSRAASGIVGNSGHVTGIDILPEMLGRAREIGVPDNVTYLESGESSFPVESGSIDWVIMTNLFHEVEEPERFYREVTRVLTENGHLYITDWKPREEEDGPPMEHRVTPETVIATLAPFGFQIEQQGEVGSSHFELVFNYHTTRGKTNDGQSE